MPVPNDVAKPGAELAGSAGFRKLCETQTRLMVAEQSATLARMAATLTHELNTPVAVLVGSVRTLRSVLTRLHAGEKLDEHRLATIEAELDGALNEATWRIQDVLGRVQRFANLYGAETMRVRLDDLITDVVALLDPKLRQARTVELELQPVVTAECHPDQIAAVISSLLHHVLQVEPTLRLTVHADSNQQNACIRIVAPDLYLDEDKLRCVTHPGLEADRCSWNIYSARQILVGHGGDMSIGSRRDTGTEIELRLPTWHIHGSGQKAASGPSL
jgi:signal transduction histidine kinase